MRKYIMFFVKLLIAYGLSMVLYAIVFSTAAAQAADNDAAAIAEGLLGMFGLPAFLVFNAVLIVQFIKDSTLRREFQQATMGVTQTAADYLRYTLREMLIFCAVYALFQLPYCIFYGAFGYDHVNAIFVDQFFVMSAGFYRLCGGNGYVGLAVSALLFGAVQLGARALILRRWDANRLRQC